MNHEDRHFLLGLLRQYWYLSHVISNPCVPWQVDATRSVDEVFIDVCAIFGGLPKLQARTKKKGKSI